MAGNKNLRNANANKKDEFYTRLEDIEIELKHYKEQFKNKTILCNCDDPFESNFFKYFAMNFERLEIKKLIATCYETSPIVYKQLDIFGKENDIGREQGNIAYKIEITEVKDINGDGAKDLSDVELLIKNENNVLTKLEGNGDFRSPECINLLEEADIVVTNPPFSMFREFLSLMVEKNKDFIVIGNTNALTYKEMFSLFKDDRIRTGYTNFNVGMFFYVPDYYEKFHRIVNGRKQVRVASSCWYTTLPVLKHKEYLTLYKTYKEGEYNRYYNYNAINVDTYKDIPDAYDGVMGVPVTFLDKYNPEQFELIGLGISNSGLAIGVKAYTEEHRNYRKNVQHKGAVNGDLYMLDENGYPSVPYARILIKNKML